MSVAAHEHGNGAHAASFGETAERIDRRQILAVKLLIGGDMIFVFCLLFTYLYLRGLNVSGQWLPAGVQTVSKAMTWTIAGVAVASALAFLWGAFGKDDDAGRLKAGTTLALVLLLADLVLQIAQLAAGPFHSPLGGYASSFLVMAGYHVFHLLVGLFIGVGILVRTSRGLYVPGRRNQVRLVSYWWAWVGLSALLFALCLMFTAPLSAPVVP